MVNIIYIIIRKLATKLKLWDDKVAIIIFLIISILAVYISKKNKVELYIPILSNNTYDIMQHHLFLLFVINLIILKLSNVLNLKGFNIESFRKTIYYAYTFGIEQAKIIYSIIVIVMPLLVRHIYEIGKQKIKNRKQELKGDSNS